MLLGLSVQACGPPDRGIYADPVPRDAVRVGPAEGPAYVGRWAATASDCAARAWTFTGDRLTGPGGPACDIVGPEATPAGYSANSLCIVGSAPPKSGRLIMTLTGPAGGRTMTLSAGPFDPPINLLRCAAQS